MALIQGKNIEFVQQDDTNRRWFNEFRAKANSNPIGLETVDPGRYAALLIPDSLGAVYDLVSNQDLRQILCHFVKEKSKYHIQSTIVISKYKGPVFCFEITVF